MKNFAFMCVTLALLGSALFAGQPASRALSPLDGMAFYGVTNLPPAELKLFVRMAGFAEMGQDIDDKGRASPYDPAGFYRSLRTQAEASGVDKGKIVEFAKMIVAPYEEAVRKGGPALSTAATNMMRVLAESGDRSFLSYLEQKGLSPETDKSIRSRAAEAYVKIADVDECVEFMRKAFEINDDKGFWRSSLTPAFLGKMETAIVGRSISDETMTRLLSFLAVYTQSTSYSREAANVDDFLVKYCSGYRTSVQRLSLWKGILDADKGNELKRKHYQPIKDMIAALPKRQRVDLRDRFPDLPPLPKEKDAVSPLMIALAVGAGLAALGACASWLVIRRRKPRETE